MRLVLKKKCKNNASQQLNNKKTEAEQLKVLDDNKIL